MVGDEARATIAAQVRAIAMAWSPPDAPAGWRLTAETFAAIAEDDDVLDLAVEIPLDRLPPLLLSAAVAFLVADRQPHPLAGYYPRPGSAQPPYDDSFRDALRQFCCAEGAALAQLCATHRYQMNEVGRCLDVLPALATVGRDEPRPLALIDLGTCGGPGVGPDPGRVVGAEWAAGARHRSDPAPPVACGRGRGLNVHRDSAAAAAGAEQTSIYPPA